MVCLLAVFSILKKHLSSIYVVHCQNVSVMELFKIGLFDLFSLFSNVTLKRGVALGFEGVRTERKVGPLKVLQTCGSEMPYLAFSAGHFP